MVLKFVAGVVVVLIVFLVYVATRDGHFRYERSGLINAKPDAIYPYISDFQLGRQWSPYEKDASMERKFGGTPGSPGAFEEWSGKEMGTGRIEILNASANQQVDLRLQMFKPFPADNHVVYKLTPEGDQTRFTWSMEGEGGFMGKLMTTVINCEKMIGGQFEEGIANLKRVIESKGPKT